MFLKTSFEQDETMSFLFVPGLYNATTQWVPVVKPYLNPSKPEVWAGHAWC